GHFWLGSFCSEDASSNDFPRDVIAVSDLITLLNDLGNRIPNESHMLYLLEFYLGNKKLPKKEVPVELDLICEFDDDDKFWAVFGGNNQYEFKMSPVLGHSYVREIVSDPSSTTINYILNDINTGVSETFVLNQQTEIKGIENISDSSDDGGFGIDGLKDLNFEGSDHFTGLEWHNRSGNEPFPIRYNTAISLLQYGRRLPQSQNISYMSYGALIPNKDDSDLEHYPVLFGSANIMKGYIRYNIDNGSSNIGMEFSF
ncbi:MAG: hypothetical protein WBZ36_07875, partial [Candidatus Nitrosopolaris sp.]